MSEQAYASEQILKHMIRAVPDPGPLDRYSKQRMEEELEILKNAAFHRGFEDATSESTRTVCSCRECVRRRG